MKVIVDETGEVIAIATDDHILLGGHHRLAVAGSMVVKGELTILMITHKFREVMRWRWSAETSG